jgi:hypothetical protein
MKTIVTNAFSISMLSESTKLNLAAITLTKAREFLADEWESAVGHPDTAAVFSRLLGMDIPANRVSIRLDKDTQFLVGQYTGPRLEPGTTELPDGATITWWLVSKA